MELCVGRLDNTGSGKFDIDLAVRGIDPKRYFSIYGQLLLQLKHPLDLVDLDIQPVFGKTLQESGQLQRVGKSTPDFTGWQRSSIVSYLAL